jgi:hypothetical protein
MHGKRMANALQKVSVKKSHNEPRQPWRQTLWDASGAGDSEGDCGDVLSNCRKLRENYAKK